MIYCRQRETLPAGVLQLEAAGVFNLPCPLTPPAPSGGENGKRVAAIRIMKT